MMLDFLTMNNDLTLNINKDANNAVLRQQLLAEITMSFDKIGKFVFITYLQFRVTMAKNSNQLIDAPQHPVRFS